MERENVLALLRSHEGELERLGVKTLALFGSTARNEATVQSDIDLLVEFARPVGLFEFIDLKNYLEGLLQTRVDLGTLASMRPRLRESVLREAVYVSKGSVGRAVSALVHVQGRPSVAAPVILTAVQSSGVPASLRHGEPPATKSPHMQGRGALWARLGENPSRPHRKGFLFLH